MDKVSYTRKPCPGCGREIKRPANSLCTTCDAELRLGREEKERRRVARASGGGIIVTVDNGNGVGATELMQRMLDLVRLCGTRLDWVPTNKCPYIGWGHGGASSEQYRMESAVVDAAIEMFAAYGTMLRAHNDALAERYDAGRKAGQSFLIRLAEGDMTIRDYEREERRQR